MSLLISFVIPVYNNERYLPNAVHSVIDQDEPMQDDIEIVIVDDGSTDGTSVLADELAKKDKRIRVIHQNNQWIYAAMNRGIREAYGEYIYILNSDDILYPNSLSRMAEIVSQMDVDVVWTRIDEYKYFKDHVEYVRSDKEYENDINLDNQDKVKQIWPQLYFDHISCNQANLYRRDLMLRHPFREDVYAADLIFNLNIANEVKTAYVLKESVYRFYEYNLDDRNASIGKFYPYEHTMFSEIYKGYVDLFDSWRLPRKIFYERLTDTRIRQVTREVRSYGYLNCYMSDREKLMNILTGIVDDELMNCAREFDREWEVESRIMSGIKDVFENKYIDDDEIRKLVEGFINLRFSDSNCIEPDKWDYVINHDLNINRIGKKYIQYYMRSCKTVGIKR